MARTEKEKILTIAFENIITWENASVLHLKGEAVRALNDFENVEWMEEHMDNELCLHCGRITVHKYVETEPTITDAEQELLGTGYWACARCGRKSERA